MYVVFDENVPNCIIEALTALSTIAYRGDVTISSVSILGLNGQPDENVLHAVGKNGILITYDKDFKKQRALYSIIKQYDIGVFWVRQPTVKTVWILAQLMVQHWQKILENAESEQRPFLFEVTKTGVSAIEVFK
ncbi:MAG TPA: DUF5615 family PIN-like protein [Mucilaginibacter sp.]|jgi:predicted nuclease of predicted toxin-antitoxin system